MKSVDEKGNESDLRPVDPSEIGGLIPNVLGRLGTPSEPDSEISPSQQLPYARPPSGPDAYEETIWPA